MATATCEITMQGPRQKCQRFPQMRPRMPERQRVIPPPHSLAIGWTYQPKGAGKASSANHWKCERGRVQGFATAEDATATSQYSDDTASIQPGKRMGPGTTEADLARGSARAEQAVGEACDAKNRLDTQHEADRRATLSARRPIQTFRQTPKSSCAGCSGHARRRVPSGLRRVGVGSHSALGDELQIVLREGGRPSLGRVARDGMRAIQRSPGTAAVVRRDRSGERAAARGDLGIAMPRPAAIARETEDS